MKTNTDDRNSRIQEKLAHSRYFSFSLAIHTVLVAALGGVVLIQTQESADDFVGGGDYSLFVSEPTLNQNESQPPSAVQPPSFSTNMSTAPAVPSPLTFDSMITTTSVTPNVVLPSPKLGIKIDVPEVKVDKTSIAGALNKNAKGFGAYSGRFGDKIGRSGSGRTPGPTRETENAIAKALAWLRKVQNPDGSWGDRNKGAMTGLALLAYLGHGEYGQSDNYGLTVNRAVEWIIENGTASNARLSMTSDGWGPGNAAVYEHGIGTYALAEYYTMTSLAGRTDERVVELLRAAVRHIIDGQGPDGGWMYRFDKTQSDTSVSGWQVQALKAAHLTGLKIPGVEQALDRAMLNLERVQTDRGGYGYRKAEDRWSLTGVGVLSEIFWRGTRDSGSRKGVDFIMAGLDENPIRYQHERADLYAWYYHTQALLMFGGSSWSKWDGIFSKEIVRAQASDGSWPTMPNPGHGNLQNDPGITGTVYRTTLCVLMLEAYYRYLPAHRGM